jgi:hypothetical protein
MEIHFTTYMSAWLAKGDPLSGLSMLPSFCTATPMMAPGVRDRQSALQQQSTNNKDGT